MRIPFSREQFAGVFALYNESVWPLQWLLIALAVIVIMLAVHRTAGTARAAMIVMSAIWFWCGVVYHLGFFSRINPAAVLFGTAFVIEGALLVWFGLRRPAPAFSTTGGLEARAGWVLVVYALVAYPALGYLLGHRYPASATFGLPCPTTVFTLGVVLWMAPSPSWLLLAIPLTWALLGTTAAFELGMLEDLGLAVSAIVVLYVMLSRHRSHRLAATAGS
ncbi:MAG TPA: DUF6064 family protein [Gemmatimonadaceae bacterium]|nr:DUF6064 family protein [Gemmatimonadaceae bacterium]